MKPVLYIVIALLFLPLAWSCDGDDDERTAKADAVYERICNEKDTTKLISLWKEYLAIDAPYTDVQKARLVLCNLLASKKDYNGALEYLEQYEKLTDEWKFPNFRKALLLYNMGRKDEANDLLQRIVDDHPVYEPVGFFSATFNRLVNGDRLEEIQNYEDYLYEYYCNLKAISALMYLDNTSTDFQHINNLFDISDQLDNIVEEYLMYKKEYKLEPYHRMQTISRCNKRLVLLNDLSEESLLGVDIVQNIYSLKWNLINSSAIAYDRTHGYETTANFFRHKIQKNNGCMNFYDRFLLDTYLSYGSKQKSLSKTTYSDFKLFQPHGSAYIIVVTPNTIKGESPLINHGIVSSRVLVGCNDWNIADTTLVNLTINSPIHKQNMTLALLGEDYRVDTVRLPPGRIGANIRAEVVPFSLYQLLVADFGNKESVLIKKVLESQNMIESNE